MRIIIANLIEKTTQTSKPNWTLISIIAFAVAIFFFTPFIGTICVAALMAYLWYPAHRRLSKHMSESVSSVIILLLSTSVVVIPIIFFLGMLIGQMITLAHSLSGIDIEAASNTIVTGVNSFMASIGSSTTISVDDINNFVQKVLPDLINGVTNKLVASVSNIPHIFTSAIVYFFLFLAFLKYNKSLIRFIQKISPFEENATAKYAEKSGLIVTASLKGQFVISFTTAITSALLLCTIFDLWGSFVAITALFTLLGMVPLGSGIVIIPFCIIQMAVGDFWGGFWSLVIYLLVICNIDSVLRPHLIPKKAKLIPAMTTLATFCGIYYWGFFGIIYGPLIVVLLMTTADIYISSHPKKLSKT